MAAMTFDEYFRTVNGKGLDFDGNYGVQCFDLVNDYAVKVLGCKPFIGMYAWEIYENFGAQPSAARFTRIANTPDFVPQKGDIIVWAKSLNGKAGHCGIATGEGDTTWLESYEQNWTGRNDPCTIIKHDYSHVLGVLRPKDRSNIEKSTAPKVKSTKTRGIDISHYQGIPDFAKLKNAVDFVIVKAGYGRYRNQVDPQFERNYAECKKYGIPVGVYWYSYAKSTADALAEARACMEVIAGKTFEYPIYYDLEEGLAALGRNTVSAIAAAFCNVLEQAGYFAGIYISRSPAQSYLTAEVCGKYALWLAEYGSKLNWSGAVGMWQNSSTGRFSGISGDVDTDICYEDYPKLIKAAGLNGFPKPKPEALKELDNPAEAWWKHGDKLDHGLYAVKCRMKALGYGYLDLAGGFGGGTEAAVKDLQRKMGYKQTGEIGENFVRLVMR